MLNDEIKKIIITKKKLILTRVNMSNPLLGLRTLKTEREKSWKPNMIMHIPCALYVIPNPTSCNARETLEL